MAVRIPGGRKPGVNQPTMEDLYSIFLNAMVVAPLARLIAPKLGLDPADFDTIAEIEDLFPDWEDVLGFDVEALWDAFNGTYSGSDTNLTNLSGWAADRIDDIGGIVSGIFNGWFGSGATGSVAEVQTTIEAVKDAVINGWNISTFVSTTANFTTFAGCTELKLIAISAPSGASNGGNKAGGGGGIGGKHKAVTVDPSGLAGLDISLGTSGNPIVFRARNLTTPHTGAELLRVDYQSVGGIATGPEGYAPSASHAGAGGSGGEGGTASLGNSNSGSPGTPGASTADATGGAGGTSADSSNGTAGGAGGAVSGAALVKCGGAGGGGGGGAGTTALATVMQAGNGGAGGFPGGAGGGGGGASGGGSKVGTAGNPGAPCGWVMWK